MVALATFRQQMADFARAEQLVDLREKRRLSQEAAAHEIGVSAKSLRAWEHGGGIRWDNAKKLAGFYEVTPESIVVQEPDRQAPDLVSSLNGGSAQLERIEAKLDAVLRLLRRVATAGVPMPEADLARALEGSPPTAPTAQPAESPAAPDAQRRTG